MKKIQEKLSSLFVLLKGKKPLVVVVSVVVFGVALFGVNKGYITEDLVDLNVIVHSVEDLFGASSKSVDTLSTVVDSTHVVVDSLAK